LPRRRIEGERWRPSEESFVNINFDAAFHKQSISSCSGIVVRDSSGSIRADLGVVRAEIVGDALSGIKKTSRLTNKVAHVLAVDGLKTIGGTYLPNEFPRSAAMEAEEDCRWILPRE
ncbi:hypothetical protein Gohar_013999, partial [Gossypium harknessii]|nr:hypothetical protein [Gossypium harknessii]